MRRATLKTPLPLFLAAVLLACAPDGAHPPGPSPDGNDLVPAPRLHLQPDQVLDFGQVPLFEEGAPITTTRKVVLLNTGSAVLSVQTIALREPTAGVEVRHGAPLELLPRAGENLAELEVRVTPSTPGEKVWDLELRSNDPERPVTTVRIRANAVRPPDCRFSVSPARVDLAPLFVPEAPEVPVTITNEGTAWMEQCLVSGVDLGPGADPAVMLVDGPIERRVLGPGEALQVPVRITVPQQGTPRELRAELQLQLSSVRQSEVTVPIRAAAEAGSCIVVAPSVLDFGTVREFCQATQRSFSVYSLCSTDVLLTRTALQAAGLPPGVPGCPGPVPCPEYSLVYRPPVPAGGYTFKSGAPPLSFIVRYRPLDLGSDAGALAITLGEGASAVTYRVSLTGAGEADGWRTDVFTMDPLPKVDLLFVIDSGVSMANDQANLATNLAAFLRYAKAAQVDFQLGVVTADPAAGSTLLAGNGHPDAVLTRDTPDLDAQFTAKVNVGATSSAPPRCLEQAVYALNPPQRAALVRDSAALSVICITDSTDHSPQPVSTYLHHLWSVKGLDRKTTFTFNAIAGFSPGCPGDQGRLAKAVSQTNGVRDDLCTPDWHKTFEGMGKVAMGFRTSFFLTSVPDLLRGALELSVDGVPVPPVDSRGATVWTYDPVGNAINFEPLYLPRPGQTLTIRYPLACR